MRGMTVTHGSTVLRRRFVRVITRRAGSSTGTTSVVAAARLAHEELIAALSPLIGGVAVEALWERAFVLVQREYPAEERRGENHTPDEPFARVTLWLERQDETIATDAAAAIFATFAELLAALIGEPLTTRYLKKAYGGVFSINGPPGRKNR